MTYKTNEFSRPSITEEVLCAIGRQEMTVINYKVHGFWSSSTISIYIHNNRYGDQTWRMSISNSSGGRDDKELEFDEDAYICKAAALVDACKVVKELKQNIDKLNAHYDVYKEEIRIAAEEEAKAKRLAMEADPMITQDIAKSIIKDAISVVREGIRSSIQFSVRNPSCNYNIANFIIFPNKVLVNNVQVSQKHAIGVLTRNMSISSAREAREETFKTKSVT